MPHDRTTILAPYTAAESENADAEESYLLHRASRRFAPSGAGFIQFTAEQIAKLAQVNLKAAAKLNQTLEQGFDKVDQGQKRIHGALIDQTAIIEQGLDRVTLSVDLQTQQQAHDAQLQREQRQELIHAVDDQTKTVAQGFKGLAASIDMGMSGLMAEFELQRTEIQEGLEKVSELLHNQHKTGAQERFRDGQEAYANYLRHPDEPRFLRDAEEYLTASVSLYKGNPFAHLYLGHIYHEAGPVHDLQRAQEHYLACATYAKGIDNQPLAAQGYCMGAWIAYVRRLPARAIELGRLSVEYDPQGLPEAYFNLGKYYAHSNYPEEAIAQLDIAIKTFDPLYSLKASLDRDYQALGPTLDTYFAQLKAEEQEYWDARLAKWLG